MAALDTRMNNVSDQLRYAARALHLLSLNYDLYEHEVLGVTDTHDLRIANNTLDGGDDNDTIAGNNATIATPFDTTLPTEATDFKASALEFFDTLSDLQYVTVDFGFVVEEARLQVLNTLADDAVAKNPDRTPIVLADVHDPAYHVLYQQNDMIDGGRGDDTIYGDEVMFFAPLVNGETYTSADGLPRRQRDAAGRDERGPVPAAVRVGRRAQQARARRPREPGRLPQPGAGVG